MSKLVTELSPPSLVGVLLPCVSCNRTFLPEALARHQNICEKTANKKRNVFSSSHQRLQGTGIDPEEVHRSPSPPSRRRSTSRSSWRDKHKQLLTTVRSARGEEPAPAAPVVPPDYEQCPYCARHFGPKAADRHISWCKEQKSRIVPNTASTVAKDRLDARVKYQAPLPLKPRPKRLSVERLSRESSPAVSVASSAAVQPVRSPTRQTRDYAREYRERASQEREQKILERKRSPAAISSGYGQRIAAVSRLAREGSEPRNASPPKESFRRTQSFRTRPGATRGGLKHQRTAGQLGKTAGAPPPVQQQRRDEPDGGEDVQTVQHRHSLQMPPDSGDAAAAGLRHELQRSTSSPAHPPAADVVPMDVPSSAVEPGGRGRLERSPPPPPPPPAGDEAYITRSQLDELHRLSESVKQPDPASSAGSPSSQETAPSSPSHDPPPSLDADLDASLTSGQTSDGEGADTYRVTSGQVRRRLHEQGARLSGRSLNSRLGLTGTALRPSPRRLAEGTERAPESGGEAKRAAEKTAERGGEVKRGTEKTAERGGEVKRGAEKTAERGEVKRGAEKTAERGGEVKRGTERCHGEPGVMAVGGVATKTTSRSGDVAAGKGAAIAAGKAAAKTASAAAARGTKDPRETRESREVRDPRETKEPRRSPDEVFVDSLEDLITVTECQVLVKPRLAAGRGGVRPRGGRPADVPPGPTGSASTVTAGETTAGQGIPVVEASAGPGLAVESIPAEMGVAVGSVSAEPGVLVGEAAAVVSVCGGSEVWEVSGCSSLPSLRPPPAPRPRPRPRRAPRLTLPPLAAATPRGGSLPPADAAENAWSEPPWRPIDDTNCSSNRSSEERNGGCAELQFSGSPLDDGDGSSPTSSLYEAEMPDFDFIMEQARRASERKNNALSPRKARMRGLDMREMMGLEVADLNMKNGGGGGGGTQRFCHECGSQYPVQAARFCCQCGAQKLAI